MKNFKKILLTIPILLSLSSCDIDCGCNIPEAKDWIKFDNINDTYYPTQVTYVHQYLNNYSCPDYEHFEIISFKEKWHIWYTHSRSGLVTVSHRHSELLGINVSVNSKYTNEVFLKEGTYRFFIDKCPYCVGE